MAVPVANRFRKCSVFLGQRRKFSLQGHKGISGTAADMLKRKIRFIIFLLKLKFDDFICVHAGHPDVMLPALTKRCCPEQYFVSFILPGAQHLFMLRQNILGYAIVRTKLFMIECQ